MPNRVEKCPLCNFEVALSSNHPHDYKCPNLHRPFSQWLGADSGYPSYPHPDERTDDNPIDLSSTLLEEDDTQGRAASDIAYAEDPIPDTSTPDTPEFGGGGDFAGGGGGDSW